MSAEIVKTLGSHNSTARCPAHDDRSPSLSDIEALLTKEASQ